MTVKSLRDFLLSLPPECDDLQVEFAQDARRNEAGDLCWDDYPVHGTAWQMDSTDFLLCDKSVMDAIEAESEP